MYVPIQREGANVTDKIEVATNVCTKYDFHILPLIRYGGRYSQSKRR